MTNSADRSDALSPLDNRYYSEELARYLSDEAFIRYKLMVEVALVQALFGRKFCSEAVWQEVEAAAAAITPPEIYAEEEKTRHDVRALVNCLRNRVSPEMKPYVHLFATSADIVDTANALRYRDAVRQVLIPELKSVLKVLVDLALSESETEQIGRTHGQHAIPITFGFAMAGYVSRLGGCLKALLGYSEELRGKLSGAVGAYNALFLFFPNPEKVEAEFLSELDLKPAEISTQIVPPEALARLLSEVVLAEGILANIADDFRHLQRTEIGEVGEDFGEDQVGSSTMPQKRNPVSFEHVKSLWKTVVPRILTVFMDQISEHQRDLTNSASSRTYGEIIAYAVVSAKRLARALKRLALDYDNIKKNLRLQGDVVSAEPLYIILASLGHPDAHEKVRHLTLQATKERRPLMEVAENDPELKPYHARIVADQFRVLKNPELYTGIAAKKARAVALRWKTEFDL
ncbi:MAG: lyase family protein [bacterium]